MAPTDLRSRSVLFFVNASVILIENLKFIMENYDFFMQRYKKVIDNLL